MIIPKSFTKEKDHSQLLSDLKKLLEQ